jgi:hypothetical protein
VRCDAPGCTLNTFGDLRVACADGSDCNLRCRNGSECIVGCGAGSTCDIDCDSGASCLCFGAGCNITDCTPVTCTIRGTYIETCGYPACG